MSFNDLTIYFWNIGCLYFSNVGNPKGFLLNGYLMPIFLNYVNTKNNIVGWHHIHMKSVLQIKLSLFHLFFPKINETRRWQDLNLSSLQRLINEGLLYLVLPLTMLHFPCIDILPSINVTNKLKSKMPILAVKLALCEKY